MAAHHCSCLLRMELVSPTGSKLEGDGSSSWIVSYEFLNHPNSTFTKTRSNRKTTSQSLVFLSDGLVRRPSPSWLHTAPGSLCNKDGDALVSTRDWGHRKKQNKGLWNCDVVFSIWRSLYLWNWNLDSSEIHISQSSILQNHPANSLGWNRFYGLVLMWRREVCLGVLKWIILNNVMGWASSI